ncbi:hypothetical protein Taro_049758 [Colocasia esculenta]|uniref:Uncharacterized protein n=1 Tax=Colocasia esculenta TaxID=4460 RepID=A0A843XC38_COLES|nr:hypothetical protein [Colocasia esculenta]
MDGPSKEGPEEEEAPTDDETRGSSRIGGGGGIDEEMAGDEEGSEGKSVGDEMVLGTGCLKVGGAGGAVEEDSGEEGAGTIIYYKGSVDTPHDGVDTMLQALSQNMKNWSTSVDTRPGQVDTRGRSQRILFTVWDMVSTLDHLRSTLETSPRELICQSGTVCRHTLWAGRHTPESL